MKDRVDERGLVTVLHEVGDAYLRTHPADPDGARRRVEALRKRRAARRGGGLAVAASVALAVAVPWLGSGLSQRATPAPEAAATNAPDSTGPGPISAVGVGPSPTSLAVTDDGSIWVGHSGDNSVRRIDPVSTEVVETRHTVEADQRASVIATNGREIYMADAGDAAVAEVAAGSPRSTATAGYPAADLVYNEGSLWAAENDCGPELRGRSCVRRLYLYHGSLSPRQKTLDVGCCPITAVAVADDEVWVATAGARGDAPGLIRLQKDGSSPPPGVVVALGEAPADLALDSDTLWAALPGGHVVARLDTRRPQAAPLLIPVRSSPVRLALGRGVLWAAGWDGRVVRIDTESNVAAPPLEVGGRLADIAVSRGEAWVAAPEEDVVYRIKP